MSIASGIKSRVLCFNVLVYLLVKTNVMGIGMEPMVKV